MAVNRLAVQIPWLSREYPARYDVFGEASERYNYGKNSLLSVFFDPSTPNTLRKNPNVNELMNLWQAANDARILPGDVKRKITINKKQVELTNEQLATYARYVGQLSSSGLTALFASPNFAGLRMAYKKQRITELLSGVNQAAKVDTLGQVPWSVDRATGKFHMITPKATVERRLGRAAGLTLPAPTGILPPRTAPPEMMISP
jgi:hypothetical protein